MPTPRTASERRSVRRPPVSILPSGAAVDVAALLPEASIAARQPSAVDSEARRAMIAEAAYFRAEKRGFVAGREVDDWLAAEADVDQLLRG